MENCADASAIQGAAAELFQLASLLLGDQAEAVGLVEETVSTSEIDPCIDPAGARALARRHILMGALKRLRVADPASFADVPPAGAASSVCVEDEDVSAAGISHEQLNQWLASDGRHDLRAWLRALPAAYRAIFVQRAVLRQGNGATSDALQASSGDGLWNPQAVSEVYRMALCSLANSLAHSPGLYPEAEALAGA